MTPPASGADFPIKLQICSLVALAVTDRAEIRFRAERRIGELMAMQQETGSKTDPVSRTSTLAEADVSTGSETDPVGRATAGRPSDKIGSRTDPISRSPTLASSLVNGSLVDPLTRSTARAAAAVAPNHRPKSVQGSDTSSATLSDLGNQFASVQGSDTGILMGPARTHQFGAIAAYRDRICGNSADRTDDCAHVQRGMPHAAARMPAQPAYRQPRPCWPAPRLPPPPSGAMGGADRESTTSKGSTTAWVSRAAQARAPRLFFLGG